MLTMFQVFLVINSFQTNKLQNNFWFFQSRPLSDCQFPLCIWKEKNLVKKEMIPYKKKKKKVKNLIYYIMESKMK